MSKILIGWTSAEVMAQQEYWEAQPSTNANSYPLGRNNPWQHNRLGSSSADKDLLLGDSQVEHEPAACPGSRDGQWYPQLYSKEHGWQIEEVETED